MPPDEYKRRYYTQYQKRRFHKCLMPGCGDVLDYDQSEMVSHFAMVHKGWSLEGYYNSFIMRRQVSEIMVVNWQIWSNSTIVV